MIFINKFMKLIKQEKLDKKIIDLWADENPFLEKVEISLTEKNVEKIIKPYSFRGLNNQEDYNRYDEMISKAVNFWNGEFLKELDPPEEILDSNLVKAIIFQESRIGYDNRNNGNVNIMQVGNYGDASLDVLNGKGKKMEYELKNGQLWGVNYKGEAKVEKVYDSIYWGVRWFYHKAQGITTDNKRYWLSWREAVKRYGPPNDKYANNVWDIYIRGIDKRSKPPLKLWIITFFIIFSSLIFSIDSFHNRTIKSTVMAIMSDDDKTYFNDVKIMRYEPDSPLFLAVMIHDDDWWESLKAGLYQNGIIKWLAIETAPLEASILAAKFLRIKGFENPLIEVYGQTHAGHGAMYLYEVESDRLALLFQTTAVDFNIDSRWAPENYEKYGFGYCGEVYSSGQLKSSYEDLNNDNISDIMLSGVEEIICEKEFRDRIPGENYEVKVASAPVEKVFLWDKRRQDWSLEEMKN